MTDIERFRPIPGESAEAYLARVAACEAPGTPLPDVARLAIESVGTVGALESLDLKRRLLHGGLETLGARVSLTHGWMTYSGALVAFCQGIVDINDGKLHQGVLEIAGALTAAGLRRFGERVVQALVTVGKIITVLER
jgi:hypothetical protein